MNHDPAAGTEEERGYSVSEIADRAGVTRRTVHYYISQGLLSASGSEGRGSRYGEGHLDRLRLIRELQRDHLPLAEIRHRLEHLTDGQVRDLLATGAVVPERRDSAYDYVRSVLDGTNRRALPVPISPRQSVYAAGDIPMAAVAAAPVEPRPGAVSRTSIREPDSAYPAAALVAEPLQPMRSQWEHITLAPDVELHVRRPLSRLKNKAVDRLVGLARQLLEEDPS